MCNTLRWGLATGMGESQGPAAPGSTPLLPAAAETQGHGAHHPDQGQNHGPRGGPHWHSRALPLGICALT